MLKIAYVYGSVSVITDLTFAILPMFMVWKLNMSLRIRLLLLPVFGMARL